VAIGGLMRQLKNTSKPSQQCAVRIVAQLANYTITTCQKHLNGNIMKFKKTPSQEDVDEMNIVLLLAEKPILKLCTLCKYHFTEHAHDKCSRDHYRELNQVSGIAEKKGSDHYCENERELKGELPSLVADGSKCGAIGQFWEAKPPKSAKKPFWRFW
jgi:hypothetical protein